MSSEQSSADRLHDALEALLGDGGPGGKGDLSQDEVRLVAAARWLWAAAPAGARAPRPTFVLGLEDQLRADRSLMGAMTPAAPARRGAIRWWSVLATVALLVLGAGSFATQRAQPGQLLFPLRRAAESGQTALFAAGDRLAVRWLELGRQRMDDLRHGLNERSPWVRTMIDDVVAAYEAALQASAQYQDEAVRRRVSDEAAAAARELAGMAAATEDERPVVAVWLADASRSLERRVALGARLAGQLAQPVRLRDAWGAAPTPTPSSGPIAAMPALPVLPGGPGTGSVTPGATVVDAPGSRVTPAAGVTDAPETVEAKTPAAALPAATATPMVNPVTDAPPPTSAATETPRGPWAEPSSTVVSQPSNTPDRWPETSTPPPASPVPTLVPAATATAPPAAPSVAPPQPTAEPTQGEPSAMASRRLVAGAPREAPAASGL